MKHLDFMGHIPILHINKSNSFKTTFGGLSTIITFIASLSLTIYFSIQVFQRKEFTVIQNNSFHTERPILNLSNVDMMFTVSSSTGDFYEQDPSIFIIQPFMFKFTPNSNGTLIRSIEPIPFERCNQDWDNKYKNEKSLQTDLNILNVYYICPDLRKHELAEYTDTLIKEVKIALVNVYECRNNTFPGIVCKPKEVIDKALNAAFVLFTSTEYNVDNENFDKPLLPSLKQRKFSISNLLKRNIFVDTKFIKYFSDDNLIFNGKTTYNGFTYNTPVVENILDDSALMASMYISISDSVNIYERKYSKLQNLLANVGGVVKAILIISNIITGLIKEKLFNNYLIDLFFDFSSNSKGEVNNNNINNKIINNIKNVNNNNNNLNNSISHSHSNTNTNIKLHDKTKNNNINNNLNLNYNIISNTNTNNNNNNDNTSKNIINNQNEINKFNKIFSLNNNQSNNNSNKIKQIKLNLYELISPTFLLKSQKIKLYKSIVNYFNQVVSVESLISNNVQFNNIKRFVFDDNKDFLIKLTDTKINIDDLNNIKNN